MISLLSIFTEHNTRTNPRITQLAPRAAAPAHSGAFAAAPHHAQSRKPVKHGSLPLAFFSAHMIAAILYRPFKSACGAD